MSLRVGVRLPIHAGPVEQIADVWQAVRAAGLGITFASGQLHSDGPQMADLARLIDAGRVRVGIDSTYPLADAPKAHERAERGYLQGKIVLRVA